MTRLKGAILVSLAVVFAALAAVMFSQGINPKIVPILKPSYFQSYEDLGHWVYKVLRPKLFQEGAIVFGFDSPSDLEKIISSLSESAKGDNKVFHFLKVSSQESARYLKKGEPGAVSITIIRWPESAEESQELYKICETLQEPIEERTIKSLFCLVASRSKKFDEGKVKGSGPLRASLDLIGDRDYLLLLKVGRTFSGI